MFPSHFQHRVLKDCKHEYTAICSARVQLGMRHIVHCFVNLHPSLSRSVCFCFKSGVYSRYFTPAHYFVFALQ